MVDSSKMSGEELPLKVHYTQDKTQELYKTKLTNHSSRVSFLFNFNCFKYMTQDTLFIGESVLENNIEG